MKQKTKSFLMGVLRFVPFTACAIFMVFYLFGGKEFTVEEIINFTPDDKLFAALFMIVLYALKSITVFFPVSVLNIAGGFLFTPFHALIVNSIGIIAELSVPYWIGRLGGKNFAQKQIEKHIKLSEYIEHHSTNRLFKATIVRFIYIIPRDSVSRYLGTTSIPFGVYLIGSFIGAFPSMVATTLLGTSVTEPSSPMFWISISVTVVISTVSILLYRLWLKRKRENFDTDQEKEGKEDTSC